MSVREAVVLVLVGVVAAASASSKPVHITLTSNWSRTPILLEARHEKRTFPAVGLYSCVSPSTCAASSSLAKIRCCSGSFWRGQETFIWPRPKEVCPCILL